MTTKEKIMFLEAKLNAVRRAEQEAIEAFKSQGYIDNSQYYETHYMRFINNLRLKLADEVLADQSE